MSNAVKHSGVDSVEVRLWDEDGEIHLTVQDSGKGFDVDAALQGKGLGLISMRERVRMVNGKLTVKSEPRNGTIVTALVPLSKRRK